MDFKWQIYESEYRDLLPTKYKINLNGPGMCLYSSMSNISVLIFLKIIFYWLLIETWHHHVHNI